MACTMLRSSPRLRVSPTPARWAGDLASAQVFDRASEQPIDAIAPKARLASDIDRRTGQAVAPDGLQGLERALPVSECRDVRGRLGVITEMRDAVGVHPDPDLREDRGRHDREGEPHDDRNQRERPADGRETSTAGSNRLESVAAMHVPASARGATRLMPPSPPDGAQRVLTASPAR